MTQTGTFTASLPFSLSSFDRPTTTFDPTLLASIDQAAKGNSPPNDDSSPLGMILGIVFGVLAVIIAVVAVLYVKREQAKEKEQEVSEVDSVTTFYNDNMADREKEYEMAFENPVFDDNAMGRSSDAFNDESAEAVEL
jgi:hypothetical protein